ncbi:hypothetical protein WME97_22260 [Sorangium sp. So ce367]|uniref:hypothetical protein n=1 Tax=Sorangium sp. So ce367 TaxID=3133305 RepID=UPI003F62D527
MRCHAGEAISSPYRYELFVLAREPAPEIDPEAIVRARGSLRIATTTDPPLRIVHGIISEAEEIGPCRASVIMTPARQ